MADNPRLDELRRRVEKDPASIAFAQLAEEHRRAGEYDEAIRVCRSGLAQHPGYLSARVTLGRALLETGQFEDAQTELEQVVSVAPDNLAAIRALADIHQRLEDGGGQEPRENSAQPPTELPPLPDLSLAFDGSDDHFAQALDTLGGSDPELQLAGPAFELPNEEVVVSPEPPLPDPVLTGLEGWLVAILADREARRAVKARPTHAEARPTIVGRPFTGRQD